MLFLERGEHTTRNCSHRIPLTMMLGSTSHCWRSPLAMWPRLAKCTKPQSRRLHLPRKNDSGDDTSTCGITTPSLRNKWQRICSRPTRSMNEHWHWCLTKYSPSHSCGSTTHISTCAVPIWTRQGRYSGLPSENVHARNFSGTIFKWRNSCASWIVFDRSTRSTCKSSQTCRVRGYRLPLSNGTWRSSTVHASS